MSVRAAGVNVTVSNRRGSASDLIVNVEVPLALILAHHPRLLQQEVGDLAAVRFSSSAELNLKVFPLIHAKPKSTIGGGKQAVLINPDFSHFRNT